MEHRARRSHRMVGDSYQVTGTIVYAARTWVIRRFTAHDFDRNSVWPVNVTQLPS